MALMLRTIYADKNPTSLHFHLPQTHFLKSPNFIFPPPNSRAHSPNHRISTPQPRYLAATKSSASFEEPYISSRNQSIGNSSTDFDTFLSVLEFISLASTTGVCVYVAVRCGVQKAGTLGLLGNRIIMWQCVVLVVGLAAGAVLRRRQWRRICSGGFSRGGDSFSGVNLLERVEKLEEDLRSATTIIQALSRRLEKLGIRFRLTRKALKEPIAETAALVQKNSEATQALAGQGVILEKELGEIQKALLSMQDQQRKQLELILAIAKAGKMWETKRVKNEDPQASKASKPAIPKLEINQIKTLELQNEGNNDRP